MPGIRVGLLSLLTTTSPANANSLDCPLEVNAFTVPGTYQCAHGDIVTQTRFGMSKGIYQCDDGNWKRTGGFDPKLGVRPIETLWTNKIHFGIAAVKKVMICNPD